MNGLVKLSSQFISRLNFDFSLLPKLVASPSSSYLILFHFDRKSLWMGRIEYEKEEKEEVRL